MPSVQADYIVVQSMNQLDLMVKRLSESDVIALDLETSNLDNVADGYIVGLAFSVKSEQAWYVPVGHTTGDQLEAKVVYDAIRPILEDSSRTFVIYNAKFDTRWLQAVNLNIPVEAIIDCVLDVFVADEGHRRLGLKEVTEAVYGYKMVHFDDLFPKSDKVKNIGRLRIDLVAPYACEDADYTLRHHVRVYDKVRNSFIHNLEQSLWPIVQEIEDTGFAVDTRYMDLVARCIEVECDKLREIIYSQASRAMGRRVEFNIASPPALRQVLFDGMRIPVRVRTAKTKEPSTSEKALGKLKDDYPICANVLTYRSMEKNINTQDELLPSFVRKPRTSTGELSDAPGRIHTSYNQIGATTGRFSSSKPNTQNQAKEKEWMVVDLDGSKRKVSVVPRDAFIAGPNHFIMEFDFKQIEFIIIAAEAGEYSIIESYQAGEDPHVHTGALIFDVPLANVTKFQRGKGKTYNYLIIYGGSAYGLSQRSDLTEEEAEADIEIVFSKYPNLKTYIENIQQQSRLTHKVSTHFGRSQTVLEFKSTKYRERMKAERSCVNRIIQGTAADIHKIGIIRAVKRARQMHSLEDAHMVAQSHDSQTWEFSDFIMPWTIASEIADAMSPEVEGYPRILVDVKIGISWGTMYDYDMVNNRVKLDSGWVDLDEDVFQSLLATWRQEREDYIETMTNGYGQIGSPVKSWIPGEVSLEDNLIAAAPENTNGILIDVLSVTLDQGKSLLSLVKAYPGPREVTLSVKGKEKKLPFSTSLGPTLLQQMLSAIIEDVKVVEYEKGVEDEQCDESREESDSLRYVPVS